MNKSLYAWLVVSLITVNTLIIPVDPCFALQLQASWYSTESLKKEGTYKTSKGVMANGKLFSDKELVCASWDFPLNTYLLISNPATNKTVIVLVSDRTNRRFKGKRIDLSKEAFRRIAPLKSGLCKVLVEVIK